MILLALLVLAWLPTSALAYAESALQGSATIEVTPANPGSYTDVALRAISYADNLHKAIVSWSVNGVPVRQGVGATTFNFKTGAAGVPVRVHFQALGADGKETERELVFNPADVDLLWEADGYVPTTYKGKSLLNNRSVAHVAALPSLYTNSGKKMSSRELSFTWYQDGQKRETFSGYGKDQANFSGFSSLKDTSIKVVVADSSETIVAERTLALRSYGTQIMFYEESPLQGTLYNRAYWDTYTLREREVALRAEAYFGTTESRTPTFSWQINNLPAASDPENSGILVLRQDKPGSGNAVLSCTLGGTDEGGSARLNLIFGGTYANF